MNNFRNLILITSINTLLVGCGDWQKAPIEDLKELREKARAENNLGTVKPREITNTVIVEKPKVVIKEESTIDDKFIVITPDAQMTFNETQESVFKVRARVLIPGVEIKLVAQGLPQGAVLEASKSEKDLYLIRWTPALYTVPSNANMRTFTAKLVAEIASVANDSNAQLLRGLVREKEINLFLFRTQESPSPVKVSGLTNEVMEGTSTPFEVTVRVPGVDDKAAQKPRLTISYDGVSYTAGNNFLEQDGSRHIVADLNKKEPVYMGDFVWKFVLLFDTKNIPVQPQLAKDGTFLLNSDGTRVRFSVKALSPFGLATPEHLVQLKIRLKPVATPEVPASDAAAGNGEKAL